MGVFQYSDESSAHSSSLPDKVPQKTIAARAKKLMSIQRRISKKKNRALVGLELDVLVEGPSEDSELVMMGRHAGQAPEIDGCVYLSGGSALPGEFRRVRITQASDYDLVGELEDEDATGLELPPAAIALSHRASDGRRVLRTYR